MDAKYHVEPMRIYKALLTHLVKRIPTMVVTWHARNIPDAAIEAAEKGNIGPMESAVPCLAVGNSLSFATAWHSFEQHGTIDMNLVAPVISAQKKLV